MFDQARPIPRIFGPVRPKLVYFGQRLADWGEILTDFGGLNLAFFFE